MKRSSTCSLLAAIVAAAAGLCGSTAMAQDYNGGGYYPGHPKMFRNYYVGGPGQGAPAQLYVSPRPTPAYVGHTWITYEPLMPHEFLYRHHRAYYAHNADGSWTTTRVHWNRLDGLPFVRTLIDNTHESQDPYSPWQNPWGTLR
jgi:hypothetical protein